MDIIGRSRTEGANRPPPITNYGRINGIEWLMLIKSGFFRVDYIENFEGPKLLDSSGLTIEWKESENHSLFIITLPKPEKSPEAYFVGMVVPHNSSDKARYITLEYGMDVMNQPYTVLCGWDGKTHLNYAEGDEPTVEAFINTLVSMLKKE